MASSSFTPKLGLCSWSESDRPKRIDFVTDNLLIDEKLGGHLLDTDIHMSLEEKQRMLSPYTVFEYSGNGESERTLSLSDTYSFVILYQKFYPAVTKDSEGNMVSHLCFAGRLFGSGGEATLQADKLTVTQDSTATDGVKNNFNENHGQYVALLFK